MSFLNIFLSFVFFKLISADQLINCGDWHSYTDEKCFNFINDTKPKNFEDAKIFCYELDESSLVTIRSQHEQDYIFNLLTNEFNLLQNIWLGIKYFENEYKWLDSTALNYTNWANGFPVNISGYECVQMVLTQPFNGQWFNIPCNTKNLFICEKTQIWLFSYLQKTVMELRSELMNTKNFLQNELLKTTPPGTVAYFTNTTQPLGWLKANGQSVSRFLYSSLFSIIGTTFGSGDGNTTFTLPDLRGEFIRGWSDGRDVDTNRSFGTFQWGSSLPYASYVENQWNICPHFGMHQSRQFAGKTFDGGFHYGITPNYNGYGMNFNGFNNDISTAYIDANKRGNISQWSLLQGTRPRNIALLACIKY